MSFLLSKALWFLLQPLHAVILMLLVGALLRLGAARGWRKSLSTLLFGIAASTTFLFGFTNLPDYLLHLLERDVVQPALPASPAGIIVLGGGINVRASSLHGTVELNHAAERIVAGLVLMKRFPQARLVYSGGAWSFFGKTPMAEALWAARLAGQLSGQTRRLVLETRSRNTWENALYTRELVKPQPGQVWILVTSAWHARRARATFEKAGFQVLVWPVDFWSEYAGYFTLDHRAAGQFLKAQVAVKEFVGILAYRLMGRL